MVDGILLRNSKDFMVNENLTILNDDEVCKSSAWDESLDSDPFILSGSEVISGSGEILVCSVGENCSLRVVTRM
jgi:magnesium-transporting ATPase (P-type)